MPAYMMPIVDSCARSGCTRQGRHSVFNTYNGHIGDYCKNHARKRVAELNRKEKGNGEKEKA